jgi:hypothetical protein
MAQRNIPFEPWSPEIVLRDSPNWIAVIFFGVLGLLHLGFSLPSFLVGYWEGYLSVLLGTAFISVSAALFLCRSELSIRKDERRICVRRGVRRLYGERSIPFDAVRGVRLTLTTPPRHHGSHIELLCDEGEINCPMTRMPRQQALLLAMLTHARLIKICADGGSGPSERVDRA